MDTAVCNGYSYGRRQLLETIGPLAVRALLRGFSAMRYHHSLLVVVTLAACSGDEVKPITDVNCVNQKCDGDAVVPGVSEERVFPELTFKLPVQVAFSPSDSHRAFVVEHGGTIRSFDTQHADHADVVLDLTDEVHMNAPPHFEAGLNGPG